MNLVLELLIGILTVLVALPILGIGFIYYVTFIDGLHTRIKAAVAGWRK